MNNKLLITVYVLTLEKKFDLFVPSNKQINEAILLIEKALKELSKGAFTKSNSRLYKRTNFEELDYSKKIKEELKNGAELILI